MMIYAVTNAKIEACIDATQACGQALAFQRSEFGSADATLEQTLAEAACVTGLTADYLERVPELRDMVLRVCVEICERAALTCARDKASDELAACAEALAACAAICRATAVDQLVVMHGNEGAVAGPAH